VKVVLTNDDGLDAEGLRMLRTAPVREGFEVVVVAPHGNRSGLARPWTPSRAVTGGHSVRNTGPEGPVRGGRTCPALQDGGGAGPDGSGPNGRDRSRPYGPRRAAAGEGRA
jgi:hypothetical protein